MSLIKIKLLRSLRRVHENIALAYRLTWLYEHVVDRYRMLFGE